MRYVIASLGRCGSTFVAQAVGRAVGRPVWITGDLSNLPQGQQVIKTHAHFQGERFGPFCAIFVWGFVEDIVASLMSISDREWMLTHLAHLQVDPEYVEEWQILKKRKGKIVAWRYLIDGDKLRFVENIRSWAKTRALFIQYEKLCMNPDWKFRRISNHIGLEVCSPKIRPRQSDWRILPVYLQRAICENYPSWIRRVK